MRVRGRLVWLAAVAVVGGWGFAAQAEASVYWANQSGSIGRANLDGTNPDGAFIGGGSQPIGVAVDGQHVYWTNAGSGTIGRANLDGSGVNESFITGASNPLGVAADGGHVYWTNANTGAIGRANLDGTGVNQSFISGQTNLVGVAVDGRYVYWARQLSIGRANLDGSGVNQNFIGVFAGSVAVDDQHVYWAFSGFGTIGRANLDGSSPDENFIVGASQPASVAVDGQHVYWLNATAAAIGRANLDGSDPDQGFITSAVNSGQGLAVDGGPAGTASASTPGLGFGTQPLGTLGAPQPVTITNTGHGNLQIDAARVTAGDVDDFLISHDTCSQSTLPIGATCTIDVRFDPSAGGQRQATLTLNSNDPVAPLQIALQGTAGALPQGPAGAARASLTRHNTLYATGTASPTRLVLDLRRSLPAGRYTLTLNRHGRTTRTPITIA